MLNLFSSLLSVLFGIWVTNIFKHNKENKEKLQSLILKHDILNILEYFDQDNISSDDTVAMASFSTELKESDISFKPYIQFYVYQDIRGQLLHIVRVQLDFLVTNIKHGNTSNNDSIVEPNDEMASNLCQLLSDVVRFNHLNYLWYRKNIKKFQGNNIHTKMKEAFETRLYL